MAIDTAAKRSSSLDHEEVWQFGAPLPDGTISQGDRQHSIWSYSGILATGAAPVEVEEDLAGMLFPVSTPSRALLEDEELVIIG